MNTILSRLRGQMARKGIGLYLLPRTDQHQSELLDAADERVAFISGFTGSNAFALVSPNQALLYTDGRYAVQAPKQLYPSWEACIAGPSIPKWQERISTQFDPSQTVIGLDARLFSADFASRAIEPLIQKGFSFKCDEGMNLIDEIWTERPQPTQRDIFCHEQWAGRTRGQKVAWVRTQIAAKNGTCAIFSELSQISWILNLRSSELPFTPFFRSILVIQPSGGALYLPPNHPNANSEALRKLLAPIQLGLMPYPPSLPEKALCSKVNISWDMFQRLKNPIEWNDLGLYRCVRTQKQIEGFKACHIRDGVAQTRFWAWRAKAVNVNQYKAARQIDEFRQEQRYFMGPSFETISATGPNSAIIHYRPPREQSSPLKNNQVHLVDSGGQYLDGTTDVTRVFHFGNPTEFQKEAYTRVLLGNLDIERLVWPATTELTGGHIQVLARRHLWMQSMDFQHSTGHGVGHFQGVHEGPVGISWRNNVTIKPNMVVTNEPGFYQQGQFGIRIENMLVASQSGTNFHFENMTQCPYDRNLIARHLLTPEDAAYIDRYHQRVFRTLEPLLTGDSAAVQWLRVATAPL